MAGSQPSGEAQRVTGTGVLGKHRHTTSTENQVLCQGLRVIPRHHHSLALKLKPLTGT